MMGTLNALAGYPHCYLPVACFQETLVQDSVAQTTDTTDTLE